MDEMDLEETPAQQPDDPFKGDAAVSGEAIQTEQPASEQPATAEVQPVTAEAQPQPQPAAEAVAEEKPKWQKIVGLVALICITVAGFLSALFMCLLSVSIADVNVMLKDVADNINEAAEAIGNTSSFAGLGPIITTMFTNAYILLGMVTGIVAGIVLGIILIVKVIKQFAVKKPTTLEKTAITSCLFFFATSVIVLSLANTYMKIASAKMKTEYGTATLAGLIIIGILFGVYFIAKIATNYKSYLGNKTKLINGCMNLAWAVIAMVVLAVLSCAPVVLTVSEGGVKATVGMGFNHIFSGALGDVVNYGEAKIPEEVAKSLVTQYGWGAIGMVIQIWFIFMCGKSLHGAMRGTVAADKAVKLGSQIWRLVFAVIYLIVCIVLTKDFIDNEMPGYKMSLAAPIVILVFSVIGLVLAIVNKVLVKEKAEKKEI